MSRTMLQWLFRVGVGAAAAMLDALTKYLQGVDLSETGQWSVIAGVVVTGLTWGIGRLTAMLKAKPGT